MLFRNEVGTCIPHGWDCPISGVFLGGMCLPWPMATLAQQHIQVEFKARATAMEEPKEAKLAVKETRQHPATKSCWSRASVQGCNGNGCKYYPAKDEEYEEFRSIKLLLAAAKDEAGVQN